MKKFFSFFKKKKFWTIFGDVVFFALVGFLVTYFVFNFIDIRSGYKYPFFGVRQSVVASASMSEINDANKDYITEDMFQIQVNDVVITHTYDSYDDIQIYDVATYFSPQNGLICHRVVNKYESNGTQYVVLRGDANNVDDTPIAYEMMRGKVVSVMPGAGHVIGFFQSPAIFLAIFGSLFFILLGVFIYDYERDKHKKKKKDLEELQKDQV